MKHPLLYSTVRSFFMTFFGTLGILCGIIFLSLVFILLFSGDTSYSSHVKIRPDAQGSRKELSQDVPVILELHFNGEIGSEGLTAEKIEDVLLCSREDNFADDRVKAMLVVINSPGGNAFDSDTIYRLLLQYKERYHVPIYAYVNGLCASGGYYIACAADKICTSDVSLIGSVGVISWPPYFNVKETMEKLGVKALTLSAGIGKDELNPFRDWKEGEAKSHQDVLNFLYDRFVNVVTKSRPLLSKEKLMENLGAGVYSSPEALKLGYVDEISLLQSEVLAQLVKASGIKDEYQVVQLQTKTWWQKALEEKSPLMSGVIKHQISLPQELKGEAPYFYKYIP